MSEIGAQQMLVPLRLPAPQRADVDFDFDRRLTWRLRVKLKCAVNVREMPPHPVSHAARSVSGMR